MCDGEGESDCDCRVDSVTAGFEDFNTDVGGVRFDRDHHRPLGANRLPCGEKAGGPEEEQGR